MKLPSMALDSGIPAGMTSLGNSWGYPRDKGCLPRNPALKVTLCFAGSTWFFTVNIATRRNNRLLVENRDVLLRTAFYAVKKKHPFRIDAAVILPDHLHCL